MSTLRLALRIPSYFRLQNKCVVDGEEALLIFLHRISRPRTLLDTEEFFGIEYSQISRIFNHVVKFLDEEHKPTYRNLAFLNETNRLQRFNTVIREKIASVHNVPMPARECNTSLFLDGTRQRVCRLGGNNNEQAAIYDGKNKIHSLGYQGVSGPDGIVYDIFGPLCGRRHDVLIFRKSSFNVRFGNIQNHNEVQYVAYADKAYTDCSHVLGAYHGHNVTEEHKVHNNIMKSVRIGIEWAFMKIVMNNSYLDYHRGMNIALQPVAPMYRVSVLLANAHTCLYGSQAAQYFGIIPPNIFDFFRERENE